jgi:hypothetical protein
MALGSDAPPISNNPTARDWRFYFVSPKDFVKNFTMFLQESNRRDFIRTAMLQARVREWPLLAETNAAMPLPLPLRTF